MSNITITQTSSSNFPKKKKNISPSSPLMKKYSVNYRYNKCFSKNHHLQNILNKNSDKVSYSYIKNMKIKINIHNKMSLERRKQLLIHQLAIVKIRKLTG